MDMLRLAFTLCRFALVSVEDINGNFTPTVNVSLRFVGQNENSPNVTIQGDILYALAVGMLRTTDLTPPLA